MDREITAVLVGCGNISHVWFDAIKKIPKLKIVGVVDVIEQKASMAVKEHGLSASIDTDLSSSLKKNMPDVVFDCTTPDSRLKIVSTAFKYGCHVLVEKPLASSVDEAKKIIYLAKKENKTCAVIQNHRYNAGIRRLSKFLKTNTLGEITFCNTDFFIGSKFKGFRSHMEHVLLNDMAIHTFDAVRAVLDADPISVYCREWNPKGSWYDHDASAVAIFEFSNGIVYTYQGSWCSQGLRTPWESQWRINGERGSVTWHGDNIFSAQVLSDQAHDQSQFISAEIPAIEPTDKIDGHVGVISDFVDCVRAERPPETICDDNIKSLQMVHAAIESSKLGEKIEIS